jgi:hypothetical protein
MINTFDLLADQVFFELSRNPWTVRNVLDHFATRYSFTDEVVLPGSPTRYPGGLSFTHDQGVANAFSPAGQSAYEQGGLSGLFSHMAYEQLVNWALCACLYVHASNDQDWLEGHSDTLRAVLSSLQARDHPDPAMRDGLMSADSSRTQPDGAEITTYDSLDASLGRSRENLYLGGKTWAAYVCLEAALYSLGLEEEATSARLQADRAAATMVASVRTNGRLPAVLGLGGSNSSIIPIVEGLAFPSRCGAAAAVERNGRYKAYISSLRTHLTEVLLPGGDCLFTDGGWKLSSTSDNSWLSKVYLSQHIARTHLGVKDTRRADAAHVGWLLSPQSASFAWSDQMENGRAIGSRYYPRGVTSYLWMEEEATTTG